jgi:hypothetical protein
MDELKGKIKQHVGNLTDDDLVFSEGKGGLQTSTCHQPYYQHNHSDHQKKVD